MRVLLVNQTFYPDVVSTAQHLTDLAHSLAERGHRVRVLASASGYDDPERRFPGEETVGRVAVRRVRGTCLGKSAAWRRVVDSATFLLALAFALGQEPRPDLIVTLTSPPLLPVLIAGIARLRRLPFAYWAMDLNPEEAIALGLLRQRSPLARLLLAAAGWSFRRAAAVIALDHFMAETIAKHGTAPARLHIVPPWPHLEGATAPAQLDAAAPARRPEDNQFRRRHHLDAAFVVMYSGNHSPCHPLDTLLEAARELREEPDLIFCFVGGGTEKARVRAYRETYGLTSIRDLPYQPLAELADSLSAADLQAVVLGEAFTGILHPCKIYDILALSIPVLFIGPRQSAIGELLADERAGGDCVAHGDVAGAVAAIRQARSRRHRSRGAEIVASRFSRAYLLAEIIAVLEAAAAPESAAANNAANEAP